MENKNLFAQRLKSARMMNGFTLAELSKRIGNKVTRQSLNKYELGEVMPDSEMIGLLCNALKVRPDYFTRAKTKIELSEIHWNCGINNGKI